MSLRHQDQNKIFIKRALLVLFVKCLFLAALIGRLYYLQVLHYTKYQTLSDDNRLDVRFLIPPRGPIYDRHGVLLAGTQKKYQLLLYSKKRKEIEENWPFIKPYLKEALTLNELYRKARKDMRNPFLIQDNLSYEDILKIETFVDDLKGVNIESFDDRFYPLGHRAVSALGYIGPLSKRDLEDNEDYEDLPPRTKIGKEGLEKTYDEILRGTPGIVTNEVNARGAVLRELDREESKRGNALTLTLDQDIQNLCYEKLQEHVAGTIVGLDVHTGEIYCFASHPTYDPHLFLNGISKDAWKNLLDDPLKPLVHRAIAGLYAPGSVFKAMTALAALEGGYLKEGEKISCPGHYDIGNHRLHCWKYKGGGHGAMDLESSIEQSCDVFYYVLSGRMGIDPIMAMARRFGLGEQTALDITGQKKGLLPSKEWKMKTYKQPFFKSEAMMCGIGQSYVLASPLQLAQMMARLVNGGKAVVPLLTKERIDGETLVGRNYAYDSLGVNPQHLERVKQGFIRVFNSPFGTAYRQRVMEKGFEMGGKSSTTQVRSISKKERESGVIKNENLDWKLRDHGMFFGFAPTENPRFAVSVIIEHGGGGGRVAAPIARDILLALQKKYR